MIYAAKLERHRILRLVTCYLNVGGSGGRAGGGHEGRHGRRRLQLLAGDVMGAPKGLPGNADCINAQIRGWPQRENYLAFA